MNKTSSYIFSLLALLFSPFLSTEATVYESIGKQYINTADIQLSQPSDDDLEKPDFSDIPLSLGEQQSLVFNGILNDDNSTSDVLDKGSWRDLELFQHSNLVKTIKRTQTVFGEAALAKLLSDPAHDVTTIEKRQAIIRSLVENENLLNALDEQLATIGKNSGFFLKLWEIENPQNKSTYQSVSYGFGKSKNTFLQQTGIALTYGLPTAWMAWCATSLALVAPVIIPIYRASVRGEGSLTASDRETLTTFITKYPPDSKSFQLILIGAMQIISILIRAPQDYPTYKLKILATKFLQQQLMHVAATSRAMKNISECLHMNNPHLADIPFLGSLENFFDPKHQSPSLSNVLGKLDTNTFRGEPLFLSLQGRIFALYNLLDKETKKEFKSPLEAIGMIDAFVSMAKLYKEFQNKPVHYSFVTLQKQDTPHLSLTNAWNPFMNPEKAIPNSIEFGGASTQNMILTGQNTAGKSTFIKAITYDILLGQTFGIAPADYMIFTPFTTINTFVDVTDNAAEGMSLFANEVARAKTIMDKATSASPYNHCFIIVDEMFRGTGPEHAEELSYQFARKVGGMENVIIIESTHYPKLIQLENDTDSYTNYKIEIYKEDDGTLTRPYKIESGSTVTNIASEILAEQGLVF